MKVTSKIKPFKGKITIKTQLFDLEKSNAETKSAGVSITWKSMGHPNVNDTFKNQRNN